MNNFKYAIIFLLIIIAGCKKDFLEKRPDQAMLVPETLNDFQALLDNSSIMNVVPYLQVIGTDDVSLSDNGYASAGVIEQGSYSWAKDIYQGTATIADWTRPYQQVFYANVVLDGLEKMHKSNIDLKLFDQIKGTALFFRAIAHYHLLQNFAKPYNPQSAGSEMGIPIKLSSDVNIHPERRNLNENYHEVCADLLAAKDLLPEIVMYKTRPGKSAALGLLARIYQTLQQYDLAAQYASNTLDLNGNLIDFNLLNGSLAYPMPVSLPNGNTEVLFHSTLIPAAFFVINAQTSVNNELYESYDNNDLRKSLFFNDRGTGVISFKGHYTGNSGMFAGIAVDEMILIRAECYARLGQVQKAVDDLNRLLQKRWRSGTFIPLTGTDQDEVLNLVLKERRKELVFRNLRWTDLRRLNQVPLTAKTLTRNLKGVIYTLEPNNDRYVFPIPDNELQNHSLPQNER